MVVGAKVGSRVKVPNGGEGVVKYTGKVHYSSGDWLGIALDEAEGKNNGTIKVCIDD